MIGHKYKTPYSPFEYLVKAVGPGEKRKRKEVSGVRLPSGGKFSIEYKEFEKKFKESKK